MDETGRDAGALSDTAADVPTTPEVQGEEASVGGPLTPTLTWSLVGAAGAVAAGGSVLLIMAGSERDLVEGAEDGARWDELQQSYDRVSLYSTLGLVGMGVGLAGAATLLTLHFLGGDESPVEPTVALGPTGLVLGGRW